MIGLLAFDWKSTTIREVGNVFNRDDSTIRFAVHRLRQRLKEFEGLQNQLEELKRQYLLEVLNFQARPHFIWWKKQHADQMIQLRVVRAKGKWGCYWQQLQRA